MEPHDNSTFAVVVVYVEVIAVRHTTSSWLAMLSLGLLSHAALAQSGFYLFAAAGKSDVDADLELGIWQVHRIDDSDSNFTFGGGYRFGGHIALEGAYQDLGHQHGRNDCAPNVICTFVFRPTDSDLAALSISIVGSFQITERLDGFGRLGVTSWDLDESSGIFDDSGDDLHYGVGLRWSFDEHWKFLAEYTRADFDFDTVGIGIRFDF